jgi:hypothetical protein
MSKFKKGDRVRLKGEEEGQFGDGRDEAVAPAGHEGTVVDIIPVHVSEVVIVLFDPPYDFDIGVGGWNMYDFEIEHVPAEKKAKEKFKIGDVVALLQPETGAMNNSYDDLKTAPVGHRGVVLGFEYFDTLQVLFADPYCFNNGQGHWNVHESKLTLSATAASPELKQPEKAAPVRNDTNEVCRGCGQPTEVLFERLRVCRRCEGN